MKNTEEQRELLKNIYWVIADQLADFGMNYQYDEVSWILCLQCLLYVEMAIYLLSKLIGSCANLLYLTVIIITFKYNFSFLFLEAKCEVIVTTTCLKNDSKQSLRCSFLNNLQITY